MNHPNRESWLSFVADELRPVFAGLGAPLPAKMRIAIGFPSTGDRGNRIGECWDPRASEDQHFEILLRPDSDVPLEVAAILTHELVHAAVGIPTGHKGLFKTVAQAIGLTGPMRATVAGPKFEETIRPILDKAGQLPHARLAFGKTARRRADPDAGDGGQAEGPTDEDEGDADTDELTTRPKRQTSRMVKCQCPTCGYVVRTSRKWLDKAGAPHCPDHGAMEEDEGGDA